MNLRFHDSRLLTIKATLTTPPQVTLANLRLGSKISLCFLAIARYEESDALHTEDIRQEGNNIIVCFPKGKQYQYGEATHTVIVRDPSPDINPVSVILEYKALLKKVSGNESHLLFPALASSKTGIRSLNKPTSLTSALNWFCTQS